MLDDFDAKFYGKIYDILGSALDEETKKSAIKFAAHTLIEADDSLKRDGKEPKYVDKGI